jgi:hypothetical protein
MYVAEIPNRNSPPAFLPRESYREGGKVKNRTLANLSSLPIEQAPSEGLGLGLRGLAPATRVPSLQRSR